MSPIINEALASGAKEAVKLLLLWLIWAAYLDSSERRNTLIKWMQAGALASILSGVILMFAGSGAEFKTFLARLVGYVFFLFFSGSLVALFSPAMSMPKRLSPAAGPAIAALIVLYLVPDLLGTAVYMAELVALKGSHSATYLSYAAGFTLPWMVLLFRPYRLSRLLAPYLGAGQLLLMMALMKLVGGGIKGLSEFSLIPVVQRGVMKFTHDAVHQTFVYLLVPDHPVLTLTTWNFIGLLFGPNFGLIVTLCLLMGPPVFYLYMIAVAPLDESGGTTPGPQRRMLMAHARKDRARKALPAMVFILVVLVFWFSASSSGEVSTIYNPVPKPVIEDKGIIVIPLTDPTMDLRDGDIHKFAVLRPSGEIRFFIMKKPDGKLSVCLDACEICPPDGYGQNADFVVCLFCRTPIPTSTLGRPGGCNPIPLKAEVTDRDIRIDAAEIDIMWSDVKAKRAKGNIK